MSRISVQNVSKQFGSREIFKDLSFDIEENEFVALVGPSGSGKSTILNMIGLLDTVDSGKILINGKVLPKVNSQSAVPLSKECHQLSFSSNALISTSSVKDEPDACHDFFEFL